MNTSQPGWYPDPVSPGSMRWWDGTQWTGHRSAPYSTTTAAQLKAPEGTGWNTVWIWFIVFVPMIPVLALLLDDWSKIIDVNDPTGLSTMAFLFSPGYLIALLGGWLVYGLSVWFAYLDFTELNTRQVPQPFHWAWTFLSSAVYVIGRSVVVRRRTGSGISPMWWEIATLVVTCGVVIYIALAMTIGIIDSVAYLVR